MAKNKTLASLVLAGTLGLFGCGIENNSYGAENKQDTSPRERIEILCEEPCQIPSNFLEARKEGIGKSLKVIEDYTQSKLDETYMPVRAHLTGDKNCGQYKGTAHNYINEEFNLCLFEKERYQRNNFPDINDTDYARNEDLISIHEIAHHIWKNKADVPYIFQEGFSKGISHSYIWEKQNPENDVFCHPSLEHKNPSGVVESTENLWFRLCNEFGFTDEAIPKFFDKIENKSNTLGRQLTLKEVKEIVNEISGKDSSELFKQTGMP